MNTESENNLEPVLNRIAEALETLVMIRKMEYTQHPQHGCAMEFLDYDIARLRTKKRADDA